MNLERVHNSNLQKKEKDAKEDVEMVYPRELASCEEDYKGTLEDPHRVLKKWCISKWKW